MHPADVVAFDRKSAGRIILLWCVFCRILIGFDKGGCVSLVLDDALWVVQFPQSMANMSAWKRGMHNLLANADHYS